MGLKELQAIRANRDLPKQKKVYRIPKKSAKKLKQEAEEKLIAKAAGGSEKERWFQARRLEMTGFCKNCGKPSCKDSDEFFRFSIAHILEKAYVRSVATNEFNWIELCFWGDNSCHSQMDNKMLDMTEMSCWHEIVEKFLKMYPSIDLKERKRIPDILRTYITIDL